MKIMIGMICMGDPLYYEMAKISVPSFLRANNSVDLSLFTDKGELFAPLIDKYPRFRILDYYEYFNRDPEMVKRFDEKIDKGRCNPIFPSHTHHHLWIAMGIPMIQWYAEENGYDWCGKFDIDSYFVGDIFEKMLEEIEYCMDRKHFICVEQSHCEMGCFNYETGAPTSGFQIWKVKGPIGHTYVERYILGFQTNEQATFWARLEDGAYLRHLRLFHPGYHMVYPFAINPEFCKQDAIRFLPAYFHLGNGINPVPQQRKFEEWFGEGNA